MAVGCKLQVQVQGTRTVDGGEVNGAGRSDFTQSIFCSLCLTCLPLSSREASARRPTSTVTLPNSCVRWRGGETAP